VSRIRLYLDENIQEALADALRARGVDVLQSSIMLDWQKIENTRASFYPTSFQSGLFFVDL